MRLCFVAFMFACTSTTPTTPTTKPDPKPMPTPSAAWSADPDDDHILGDCDRCPNEAELVDSINDDDGCPESDEERKRHAEDPRVRFARPMFTGDLSAALDGPWVIDDEVESVACIAVAVDQAKAKAATEKLCAAVEKSIREHKQSIQVAQYVRSPKGREERDVITLQIMRAAKTDIWRWDAELVRSSPPPMIGTTSPDGCWVASFHPQTHELCGCAMIMITTKFIARWPTDSPVYPK